MLSKTVKSLLELRSPGVHSVHSMKAAGFQYTGVADRVRCETCRLEVSQWDASMNPFIVHENKSPDCQFIVSTKTSFSSMLNRSNGTVLSDIEEFNPRKRQKTETIIEKKNFETFISNETTLMQKCRKRTFIRWPPDAPINKNRMIRAGFCFCNVADRVMCIYCNYICEGWGQAQCDPWIIHRKLSPGCVFFKFREQNPVGNTLLENKSSTSEQPVPINLNEPCCHPNYYDSAARYASFDSWQADKSPSIDNFVQSGFFYSGTKTIVTCFYCNGSIESCPADENLIVEHVAWFPQCDYAKQLYRNTFNQTNQHTGEIPEGLGGQNLSVAIVNNLPLLNQMVDAHLDLDVSKRLKTSNISTEVLRSCWPDFLHMKCNEDKFDDCDLFIRCLIIKRQNDYQIIKLTETLASH